MLRHNNTSRQVIFLLAALLVINQSFLGSEIRRPVWAGSFYPEDPEVLSHQIDAFLHQAQDVKPLTGIKAIVVPHAGYVYSGRVAARAYSLIQGQNIETAVILSPSHRHAFEGCSIYLQGGFETPLGVAQVDESLAAQLANLTGYRYLSQAHEKEHAVEVQVPFIQTVLPKTKILPVVMGIPRKKTISDLADALAVLSEEKKILVIASSDMSHFFSKEKALRVDTNTISLIENFKTTRLVDKLMRGENIMCGGGPVVCALLYAEKLGVPQVESLAYADSSDAGGDPSSVVGYFSAAVTVLPGTSLAPFNEEDKKALIAIARRSIIEYIKEGKVREHLPKSDALQVKRGVFVTLKKNGRLRGCIGFISSPLPLHQSVGQAAVYAATRDARFPPVTAREIEDLEIEISVLSPLKKIEDPRSVSIGTHGLLVTQGKKSGLLLPQVAKENNWSKKTYLQQTCLKAGLPPDAWKKGTDIYVFEAIVIHQ